ncbi:MAG: ABC transporter ATP-binding protein [Candidatus Binatia bacterium]
MAGIRLEQLDKTYPGGYVAVSGLDLEIAESELVVLVGPSGCGKSTVLRLVAGLETPTRGRVFLGEQDVTQSPPQDRYLAMVFQNYALYPHKSVRENLAFGLRMRGLGNELIAERVEQVARTLGIESLLGRKPAQLSGGQRQRVALGRALVREPHAFLFDEPLSNLDARLRAETRTELARLHRRLGATMLYVTHDQEEAMTLSDRVAVMREGRLQQIAPPLEVYRRPANVFVGGFIGSPAMNILRCALHEERGKVRLACPAFTLEMGHNQGLQARDREVLLGVRPPDLQIVDPAGADTIARVDVVEPRGSEIVVHVELREGGDDLKLTVVVPAEAAVAINDQIGLRFQPDRLHLFDAKSGERIPSYAQETQ